MTESLIKLRSVNKMFSGPNGNEVVALDAVDLDIFSGEFISVIGPSGSGKSTLLFTIGGLMQPSSGSVRLSETEMYGVSPGERAQLRQHRIGFMFQTFNLMPYLSCCENVMLPAIIAGSSREEAQTHATELLERLGLGHRLDHEPQALSVGERQRAALARSLVNKPEVLLADEPTGNLDPAMTEEIMKLLREVNDVGQTVIMVTHDHRLALRSKRIIELSNGKVKS